MTTDSRARLVEALERFLRDARQVVEEELNRDGSQQPSAEALARSLAELPACLDAGTTARHAAAVSRYIVTDFPIRRRSGEPARKVEPAPDRDTTAIPADSETTEPSGRPLDAKALLSTGVVGALLDRADLDLHAIAEDLAGYLAGPPIDIWDYAILDGSLTIDDPVPVVDGWELITPTARQLRELLLAPATTAYQPARSFDPDDYSGLTMLRRVIPEAVPLAGPDLRWDVLYSLALDRPAHLLWQPLLALSLYENPVLRLWARYQIEPGRRVDKLFDSVDWDIWTPDGVTEIERPMTGVFGLTTDVPMLRRFLTELAPQLARALSKTKAATQLRRCAEHFLMAGAHAHGEGEVLSELNAEAVLHYVIVLEGLLTGESESPGEYTRKVSQRAAVLAGRNDSERLEFQQLVHDAYGTRSKYAHGSAPKKELDLPKLRRVVRRCLLTRLIIGDPAADGPLHTVADRALLSNEVLDRCVLQPFSEFSQRVRGG